MKFLRFLIFFTTVFAAFGERGVWQSGELFLNFLQKNDLPTSLFYALTDKEKELTSEISVGKFYYILRGSENELLQALIPIQENVQIHIYRDKNARYAIDFIPVFYEERRGAVTFRISQNPYLDALKITNDHALTNEFSQLYKKAIDPNHRGRKNDRVAFIFTRKYRLGDAFYDPTILAIYAIRQGKEFFTFNFDDTFYDEIGREISGFILDMPLKKYRITSGFSLGRFHPILKKIRPHFGVDLAIAHGTPVFASASGRVIFSGMKGGYGNVVEILHSDGIKTLYAHMAVRSVKKGARVKKGQMIGSVGSTGVSTGAHLHFGVYKNNRPTDPLKIVRVVKKRLFGSQKKRFLRAIDPIKAELRALDDEKFDTIVRKEK